MGADGALAAGSLDSNKTLPFIYYGMEATMQTTQKLNFTNLARYAGLKHRPLDATIGGTRILNARRNSRGLLVVTLETGDVRHYTMAVARRTMVATTVELPPEEEQPNDPVGDDDAAN